MTSVRTCFLLGIAVLILPLAALAHVGSADVYYEGHAGAYHLLVTIRPPEVVPGVAQIQVRSLDGDASRIEILPLTMQGPGASMAPMPDLMQHSNDDPQLYNGSLWLMLRGSWKVQIQVDGKHGKSELAVPVAAVSMTAARMNLRTGALLGVLGLVLIAAMAGIVRAANGQAQIEPRQSLTPELKRRAYVGMSIGVGLILLLLVIGYIWWGREASTNDRMVYRIPHLETSLHQGSLMLRLENPNTASSGRGMENFWAQGISMNDLVPDHGHIVHLFLVRTPDLKSFWHLHPAPVNPQEFAANLPDMPAGHYLVYADIVHANGFPETQITDLDLPAVAGQSLAGDDSGGAELAASTTVAQFSDGYRMVWERDSSPLHARQPIQFRFRVEDKDGKPATDLENYMGMAGHAVFLSDDGKVFAHVHPEGSVSMAALAMAQNPAPDTNTTGTMGQMNHGPLSAEVSFPYGFPQPGDYHLFVQVKRDGRVETGSFAAHVGN